MTAVTRRCPAEGHLPNTIEFCGPDFRLEGIRSVFRHLIPTESIRSPARTFMTSFRPYVSDRYGPLWNGHSREINDIGLSGTPRTAQDQLQVLIETNH
jgi:hypothetical protein